MALALLCRSAPPRPGGARGRDVVPGRVCPAGGRRRTRRCRAAAQQAGEGDARAAGHPALLVRSRADRPLRLLRTPPQLPRAHQLPPRSPTHLVHVPQASQPEEPEDVVERVRCPDVQLHPAGPPDHATMDATPGMTRVTFRRSRVRESRTPGSVRAKPNGRATRPRSSPAISVASCWTKSLS